MNQVFALKCKKYFKKERYLYVAFIYLEYVDGDVD